MSGLDNAVYTDYLPSHQFQMEPRKSALLIVDMQYANCSRGYGYGKNLEQKGMEDVKAHGFDAEGLLYRYDRIEKVLIPNLQRLLRFFRQHGLRVIYLTVGSQAADYSDAPAHLRRVFEWSNNRAGQREHEILEEVKPEEVEYVLNKTTAGAFSSSAIDSLLRTLGIEYLICTGVATDQCVGSTARQAAERGYHCVMVEDCTATLAESWQRMWLVTFQMLFGRVSTTDEVLAELEHDL